MIRALVAAVALLAAACVGDDVEPGTDAALPACVDLDGCDNALCNTAGVCSCVREGQPVVQCTGGER